MTALTATAIVTSGYRDAQKLARGAALPADLLSEGIDRLNDLVNLWQTQGLKLFLESEQTITLVAGQQTYSCMLGGDLNIPHPLEVKSMTYWDANSNSRPLVPIGRDDWSALTNRMQTGQDQPVLRGEAVRSHEHQRVERARRNGGDGDAQAGIPHAGEQRGGGEPTRSSTRPNGQSPSGGGSPTR